MSNLLDLLIIVGVALLGLVAIGIVFARLYKRSTKETAFVRTGLGGQKVIMDGGAIVLPVFHERVLVNMNTLKLEVLRHLLLLFDYPGKDRDAIGQPDPLICGGCGNQCAVNNCTGGVCGEATASVQNCVTPFALCPDGCVNLQTNARNCGACDNRCPGSTCDNGACVEATQIQSRVTSTFMPSTASRPSRLSVLASSYIGLPDSRGPSS